MLTIVLVISLINLIALALFFFATKNNTAQEEKYNLLKANLDNLEKNLREDASGINNSISKTALESRTRLEQEKPIARSRFIIL